MDIKPGKYRHYKGKVYDVIGVAKNTENAEELVVYRDEARLWARPKEMFFEIVEENGKATPRFKFLG